MMTRVSVSFNTPLKMRPEVWRYTSWLYAAFQYSIGDAAVRLLRDVLRQCERHFQYSIGDASLTHVGHSCKRLPRRLSILHWRCEIRRRVALSVLAWAAFFQYSIGDAMKATICGRTRPSLSFNTPLEMQGKDHKRGCGNGGGLQLSILHWRCSGSIIPRLRSSIA